MLVAAIIAGFAMQKSVAEIFRTSRPDLAMAIGHDPIAPMIMIDRISGSAQEVDLPASLSEDAKASIASHALNPTALRLMASAARNKGDRARYSLLMTLAEKVALRDGKIQLSLLQDALRSNDVPGALRHADIIIKTSEASRPEMFGALTQMLSDSDARKRIAEFFETNAFWTPEFFTFASTNSARPDDVAALALALPKVMRGKDYAQGRSVLLRTLADKGSPAMLLKFYLAIPGANLKLLSSPALTPASITNTVPPISWQFFQESDTAGNIISSDAGELMLEALALPGASAKIARKALFLRPGSYTLSLVSDLSGQAEGASVTVTIICPSQYKGQSAELAKFAINEKTTSQKFLVPENCPGQIIELIAKGGSGQDESRVVMNKINLIAH